MQAEQVIVTNHYTAKEQDESDSDVLISLDSIDKIQQAYPNYFIDLEKFYDCKKRKIRLWTRKNSKD